MAWRDTEINKLLTAARMTDRTHAPISRAGSARQAGSPSQRVRYREGSSEARRRQVTAMPGQAVASTQLATPAVLS